MTVEAVRAAVPVERPVDPSGRRRRLHHDRRARRRRRRHPAACGVACTCSPTCCPARSRRRPSPRCSRSASGSCCWAAAWRGASGGPGSSRSCCWPRRWGCTCSGRAPHIGLAAVSLAMLGLLVAFQREFYAAGDPYTRWSALRYLLVLLPLSVRPRAPGGVRLPRPVRPPGRLLVDAAVRRRRPGRGADAAGPAAGLPAGRRVLLAADAGPGHGGHHAVPAAARAAAAPAAHSPTTRPGCATCSPGTASATRSATSPCAGTRAWSGRPSGKSCVAYRVTSGVMLASGDPLGDPEAWPGAVAQFVAEAKRHAWIPAVAAASETGAEVWVREAASTRSSSATRPSSRSPDFSLDGRSMRNVRQMVNRVCRAGYTVQRQAAARHPRRRARSSCAATSPEWRVGDTERGYSMALGRFGDPADGGCVVATASQGRAGARAHLVRARGASTGCPWTSCAATATATPASTSCSSPRRCSGPPSSASSGCR